ncbi:MAG: LysR family transcriptional regulator [Kibdelosporangium sp.]
MASSMDLTLFRTFLAVYRAGTVTAAADRLGLSQSTVTIHVRALEKQLGQQLFQRLPRGVTPTAVADELASSIATHIDALTQVADRAPGRRRSLAKPVHLAGPAELLAVCVLPALADLVGRGVKLRVTTGLADDLLAGLSAGRFDLVLSTIRPRAKGITTTTLTDEEFVLVAAPQWAERIDLARLAGEGPAHLDGVPLVAYAEDMPLIRRYWRTTFATKPARTAAVVVPDLRAVLAVTLAGAGVTVLPRYLCARELGTGALVALLNPLTPPINTLFLASRPDTATASHVAAVRARLLSQASSW